MKRDELSHQHGLTTTIPEHTLDGYREKLTKASELDSPSPIPIANLYPWHARESIAALFDFARRRQWKRTEGDPTTIRLMLYAFPGCSSFEAIASWIGEALEAGANLRLLVDSPPTHALASAITKLACSFAQNDRLEIRKWSSRAFQHDLVQVFLVDSSAYRIEIAHAGTLQETNWTDKKPSIPARICFRDERVGVALAGCFDAAWHLARRCEDPPGDSDAVRPHVLKKSRRSRRSTT